MTREEFRKKFLQVFASNISPKILKKYRIESPKGFLWNLFAANLVPCFSGDEARQEYDKADKTNARLIEYDACWMFCYPPYNNPCAEPFKFLTIVSIKVTFLLFFKTFCIYVGYSNLSICALKH